MNQERAVATHPAASIRTAAIGIVVIGRNEGARLSESLASAASQGCSVLYVDSGSTDDSIAIARHMGLNVHALSSSIPFSAARARNEGAACLLDRTDEIAFVQFLDGDCTLRAGWVQAAGAFLQANADVAAVCGRLQERNGNASVYHRLCNMEWDGPIGDVPFCGGNVMMRVSAFREVGGFDPGLIAGEEPDLCIRLREQGWRICRLAQPMATHEAAITRLAQWWQRTKRAGYCYAQLTHRHRHSSMRSFQRQNRSAWFWGCAFPITMLVLGWHTMGLSIALLAVGFGLLMLRIYRKTHQRGLSRLDAALYATACTAAKLPQVLGQARFLLHRLAGKHGKLIEYKGARPSSSKPTITEAQARTGEPESQPIMHIVYALGPGDAVEAYRQWRENKDVSSEMSNTFSGQFFDLCRDAGWQGWAISSHPRRDRVQEGALTVENRPRKWRSCSGFRFHLAQVLYGLSIIRAARRYNADVVVVDSGTTHWFILSLLKAVRVRVIASLHNVLWPCGFRPRGGIHRLLHRLNGWFWRHAADATICVSPECRRQVLAQAGRTRGPIYEHRPMYRPEFWDNIAPPTAYDTRPFHILFAGRVESDKGVFDLLAMADRLERRAPRRIRWDICGTGSASDALARQVRERGLDSCVRLFGHLDRNRLRDAYARSHLVIIPTRSSFREGMPRAAAEAVLAGRPVLTSRLANARDVLGNAIIEVEPEKIDAYVAAVLGLLRDQGAYEQHRLACASAASQFYDPSRGLAAVLRRAVTSVAPCSNLRETAEKSLDKTMPLAYLTTQYPKVSHTFIRRELLELESRGHRIRRLAIRPPENPPVDPADREEMTRTTHFITQPATHMAMAILRTLITRPIAAVATLLLALRMGYRSERGLWRHVAYFVEAVFFLQILRRDHVQHVHVHFGTNAAAVACLIKKLKGPGYSFTVHGPAEFDAPRSLRLARKQSDARFVVAVTNYGAAQLRRWSAPDQWDKIHVVRCGLSNGFLQKPRPLDENSQTFVCVGRLCEQKGQLLLVRAFAAIAAQYPDARLILAGDGPMRSAIDRLIQQLQLTDRVTITGWINEQQVHAMLNDARALVLPSFAEGLPVVIMEAMALGRPVITTYVAGIPELVINHKTGWLIPAGHIHALKKAMQRALQTPAHKLQAMGMQGRRRVTRYHDLRRQAARLDALFQRYTHNGHPSPNPNVNAALVEEMA